jgi:hypothetical protein
MREQNAAMFEPGNSCKISKFGVHWVSSNETCTLAETSAECKGLQYHVQVFLIEVPLSRRILGYEHECRHLKPRWLTQIDVKFSVLLLFSKGSSARLMVKSAWSYHNGFCNIYKLEKDTSNNSIMIYLEKPNIKWQKISPLSTECITS